jgi:hypothetical protein
MRAPDLDLYVGTNGLSQERRRKTGHNFCPTSAKKATLESRHLQILFFHIGRRVSVQFLGETDLIRTHRFVGVPQ